MIHCIKRTQKEIEESKDIPSQPLYMSNFDFVLVDAQCTHDGSHRHVRAIKEETTKWKTNDTTVNSIQQQTSSSAAVGAEEGSKECVYALQRRLLAQGFQLLRESSGCLVYSTCSMEKEQNEDVVQWLLDQYPNAQLVPMTAADVSTNKEDVQEIDSDVNLTKPMIWENHRIASMKELLTLINQHQSEDMTKENVMESILRQNMNETKTESGSLLECLAADFCAYFGGKSAMPWENNPTMPGTIRLHWALHGTSGLFIAKIVKKPL